MQWKKSARRCPCCPCCFPFSRYRSNIYQKHGRWFGNASNVCVFRHPRWNETIFLSVSGCVQHQFAEPAQELTRHYRTAHPLNALCCFSAQLECHEVWIRGPQSQGVIGKVGIFGWPQIAAHARLMFGERPIRVQIQSAFGGQIQKIWICLRH